MIRNNTDRKHFEELKWLRLPAGLLSVCETRNAVLTQQLRENDHQENSPKHHKHRLTINIFGTALKYTTLSQLRISDIHTISVDLYAL